MWNELSHRLAGRAIVLEPLAPSHADGLYEAGCFPEIWQWWPFDPTVSRRRFDAWMHDALQAAADGQEARFATLDALSGQLLGSTSYCGLRPEHRGLEIGWTWLTPAVWGTGVNAESKLLLLGHAFTHLGCQRVEFHTDERNTRSRRALEALPATLEGIMRDVTILASGRRRSSAIYSILDHEWPAVRSVLEQRGRARGGA